MIQKIRIKNLFLYGGLTKEEYNLIRPHITAYNKRNLFVISAIAFSVMLCVTLFSLFIEPFGMTEARWVYAGLALVCLVTHYIGKYANGKAPVLMALYFFAIAIIVFGITMGMVGSKSDLSVTYMVMIIVTPILFSGPPYRKIIFILTSTAAFVLATNIFKTGVTRNGDIGNALVYGVLSILLSTFTTITKTRAMHNEQHLISLQGKDHFTSIGNRLAFDLRMYEIDKADEKTPVTLFVLDIDKLKRANDENGHRAGDELIKATADCLQAVFSSYGKCFRIGGDEFCVVLDSDKADLSALCTTLNERITVWSGKYISKLSVSYGYVRSEEFPDLMMMDLFRIADKRMYQNKAKKNGLQTATEV